MTIPLRTDGRRQRLARALKAASTPFFFVAVVLGTALLVSGRLTGGDLSLTAVLIDLGFSILASTITVWLYDVMTTDARERRLDQATGLRRGAHVLGMIDANDHRLPMPEIAALLPRVSHVRASLQFDPEFWVGPARPATSETLLDALRPHLAAKGASGTRLSVQLPNPDDDHVQLSVGRVWPERESHEVLHRMRELAAHLRSLAEAHEVDVTLLSELPKFTCYRFEAEPPEQSMGVLRLYSSRMAIDDLLPVLVFRRDRNPTSLWSHSLREFERDHGAAR